MAKLVGPGRTAAPRPVRDRELIGNVGTKSSLNAVGFGQTGIAWKLEQRREARRQRCENIAIVLVALFTAAMLVLSWHFLFEASKPTRGHGTVVRPVSAVQLVTLPQPSCGVVPLPNCGGDR